MDFFSDVFGNTETKERLGRAILKNAFPHAFIIEGPKGCGKHTFSLSLAAALNCQSRESGKLPCHVCNNCRRIFGKNFVDVKYITRKDAKNTIGVDEIRSMREDIYMSSTESAYKIYIIEDAQTMTPQAQNALLKIFEDPPFGVVIFLLCDSIQQILSTIKSRAQLIRMQRLTDEDVQGALLEDAKFSSLSLTAPDAFTAAIKLSHGSIGRAKEMLTDEWRTELAEERKNASEILSLLVPSNEKFKIYSAIQSLPQKRNEFSNSMHMILDGLRDLILSKYSDTSSFLFYTDKETVVGLASRIGHARLLRFYDAFTAARNKCEKNGNMNTIITDLCVTITRV